MSTATPHLRTLATAAEIYTYVVGKANESANAAYYAWDEARKLMKKSEFEATSDDVCTLQVILSKVSRLKIEQKFWNRLLVCCRSTREPRPDEQEPTAQLCADLFSSLKGIAEKMVLTATPAELLIMAELYQENF